MRAMSDLKMNRLLNLIDEWAQANASKGKMSPGITHPPPRRKTALQFAGKIEKNF
jgi:hypothetical protein